jgi:DNA mismatch endonuclease (patch repair protein)
MADVFSKEKRSEIMSRIKGKGNRNTELVLVSFFRRHKFTGWRRHRNLPGKPDFSFRKVKVALFVDGCFWHGCPAHYRQPKANVKFWKEKITGNISRDRRVNRLLRSAGWRVVRIWQHELVAKNQSKLLLKLIRNLPKS